MYESNSSDTISRELVLIDYSTDMPIKAVSFPSRGKSGKRSRVQLIHSLLTELGLIDDIPIHSLLNAEKGLTVFGRHNLTRDLTLMIREPLQGFKLSIFYVGMEPMVLTFSTQFMLNEFIANYDFNSASEFESFSISKVG